MLNILLSAKHHTTDSESLLIEKPILYRLNLLLAFVPFNESNFFVQWMLFVGHIDVDYAYRLIIFSILISLDNGGSDKFLHNHFLNPCHDTSTSNVHDIV